MTTLTGRGLSLTKTLVVVLWSISTAALAQTPEVLHDWWRADGEVYAMEFDTAAGKVYIGGVLHYVGPPCKYLSVMDTSTGVPDLSIAQPNRPVWCGVSDGADGLFIGGEFSKVGGISRPYIAHLNAAGQLITSWAPTVGGQVRAMCRAGNTLYVHGYFGTVNGEQRDRFCALDATTGDLLPWACSVTTPFGIYEMMEHNGVVYVGGYFDQVNGAARHNLVALNGLTGATTAWAPEPDDDVYSLEAAGDTIYVGGMFANIGGVQRNHIAAIDANTSLPTDWDPNMYGPARDMALSNGTVYVAGVLEYVPFEPWHTAVQLDLTTGLPTDWDPQVETMFNLNVYGGAVYLAGNFYRVNGELRSRVAAVNATNGDNRAWSPGASWRPSGFIPSGPRVFAFGEFISMGGVSRNGMAALNMYTGEATEWDAHMGDNSVVHAIELHDNDLYVAGHFDTIAGALRSNIAALNATTAVPTSWDPQADWNVTALAYYNDRIYAGGDFDTIGGQYQPYVAALDAGTGLCTSWTPQVSYIVHSFAFHGDTVYIGGSFAQVNGQVRPRLAALDTTTGTLLDWDPGVPLGGSTSVHAMLLEGEELYFAGFFDEVGGGSRGGFAAVDRTTAALAPWDPCDVGGGTGLLRHEGSMIIGGSINNTHGLASVDDVTGLTYDWAMPLDYGWFHAGAGDLVCVGVLTFVRYIDDEPVQYFAALQLPVSTGAPAGHMRENVSLAVFPNPGNGDMRLQSSVGGLREVRVVDAQGRVVHRSPYAEVLHLSALPDAVYGILVSDAHGTVRAHARYVKQ